MADTVKAAPAYDRDPSPVNDSLISEVECDPDNYNDIAIPNLPGLRPNNLDNWAFRMVTTGFKLRPKKSISLLIILGSILLIVKFFFDANALAII